MTYYKIYYILRKESIHHLLLVLKEIGMIYAVVRFITWRGDLATAKKINAKLKNLKNNEQ